MIDWSKLASFNNDMSEQEQPIAKGLPTNVERWEFYRDENNHQWRWRHVAANNRVVGAATETYHNWADCVTNAKQNGFIDTPPEQNPSPANV